MRNFRFHYHPKWWVWLGLAAFLYFVWPTPYAYLTVGSAGVLRLHRLTGQTDLLEAEGWKPIAPPVQPVAAAPENNAPEYP